MKDVMIRFLDTMGIKNYEDYDIEFEKLVNNKETGVVTAVIVKETPWDYSLFDEFFDGIKSLKFRINITFKYTIKPTINDAINLYSEWHRSHYRFPAKVLPSNENGTILFRFDDEQQVKKYKTTMHEFEELLEFINYDFKVTHELPKVEEIVKEVKTEDEPVEELITTEAPEYKERNTEEEQKAIIENMAANFDKMLEDYGKSRGRPAKEAKWRDLLPYTIYEDFDLVKKEHERVDLYGELFGVDKVRFTRDDKMTRKAGLGRNGKGLDVRFDQSDDLPPEIIEGLANGQWVRIAGYVQKNRFNDNVTVVVKSLRKMPEPPLRTDEEENKRVELHLHTKMSAMDAVSTVEDYFALAKNMGHKALAVTDHGNVQSFLHVMSAAKKTGIKPIYGCELYMVNDQLPFAPNPDDRKLKDAEYVCFDLETTGLSARYDGITEFGAVKYAHGQKVDEIDILINPEMPIPMAIQIKTKITDAMVAECPTINEVLPRILEFFGNAILVSHNIVFDVGFLDEALRKAGKKPLSNPCIDTLSLSRYIFPENMKHTLGTLSRNLGITTYSDEEAHRANYDAAILLDVWLAILVRLTNDNMDLKHSDLAKLKVSTTMYKHMRPGHVVALAKTKEGLKQLYTLVTKSSTEYLADIPKTPMTLISELRSDLLIGSACFNGDVFDTARTRSKDVLREVISFYDYVEIQPPENYSFLVNVGALTNEQVLQYIKDIIEVAEELGKIVVATGDVHYRDPENKLTRDIFISTLGVGKKPHPLSRLHEQPAPDQHYRATREMLDAFAFLGEEKAYELVVTNTNKIADMIEDIQPLDGKLRKPTLGDSEGILRESCYKRAIELFGDPIPTLIKERLDRELEGIIGNGYAVTYFIAHEIVKYCNENGYMVGSRGSVGSSLAAHFYGITEVNPLPPHYRCPKCKHYEFVDDPSVLSGIDMENKVCPECGEEMVHDGQNIPFETFLGFSGEKVPDIDLNFSSDFQAKAHNYTKVIFGEHNVFRAGTIETVADKTAFGYVRGYFEKHGINPNSVRSSTIAYMASKCLDVKRTTGQHPGGIVCLPQGMQIEEFTPIQYPSDNKDAEWLTTHFDYHGGLDNTLLKLDLLGHVDPLALKRMEDLTGVDAKKIPLNDEKVLSLFNSGKALNLKSDYLKYPTGSLGIPEFGTDTAIDTLRDAQPKQFADLVIISGLSHGEMVWGHNAQDLIRSGQCTINEVIGCRDDIMTYLIKKGLPKDVSFKIMESVRKGKKVSKDNAELMRQHNVPEWYIESCNKIRYMFPKAHAVAYVTMAIRVGYFKVYYPLEYYAVWFSVRSKDYDIKPMLGGLETCIERFDELKRKINARKEPVTPKEKDIYNMLKIAIEMHERGYRFENIDLYKSGAADFIVDHENKALILPFAVLPNLGEAAAESVLEARKDGPFKSKEDLLERTKLSKTNVEQLDELGVLKDLRDSTQMSLFEFDWDA